MNPKILANLKRKIFWSISLFTILLILLGLEVWEHISPLPARDWIASNFKKINIADPKSFSFAVFGDNKNSHVIFERLLKEIDRDPEISFVIDIGDLVYDGEKEKYRYFLGQIRNYLHKPLLTAIGNHELKENGRGLYAEIFGPFYYSFRIGKVCFFILDDANEKGLDRWQRIWLEREFKRSKGLCAQWLVFFHVPLYDPRGGYHRHCLPSKAADDLLNLFKTNGVSHIFSSHIHGFFQGSWHGIPYTITGGAGAELVGDDPNHYFFHYLKIKIENGNLQIKVKRLSSSGYEKLDRWLYAAWLNIYAFLRFHGLELSLLLTIGILLFSLVREKSSMSD